MIKVEIKYKGRTKFINAVYVDVKEAIGAFDIYVLDATGGEHRENSANEELEVIYVNEYHYDIAYYRINEEQTGGTERKEREE